MEQLILKPVRHVEGEIKLPGSKSLSNRLLLISALAHGATEVHNLLDSDDTRHVVAALRTLGVSLDLSPDRTSCLIEGLGGPFAPQETSLFAPICRKASARSAMGRSNMRGSPVNV